MKRRVGIERESRGWTYESLAKRMTDAGCPINASAIYKIEKADPPRRITVDELVALSRVLDLSAEDLLTDPDLAKTERLAALLESWRAAAARRVETMRQLDEESRAVEDEILALIENAPPETKTFLRDYFAEQFPEGSHWYETFLERLSDALERRHV